MTMHSHKIKGNKIGLKGNLMLTMTIPDWFGFLHDNQFKIDPRYLLKALIITEFTPMNTLFSIIEYIKYKKKYQQVKVKDPLFIIGHWRQGTTHLHNLLACDPAFAYPDTYDAVNARSLLLSGLRKKKEKLELIPEQRPMDNMAVSAYTPQEEELAMFAMNKYSPMSDLVFSRTHPYKLQYIDFNGLEKTRIKKWKTAYLTFLKKLTYKYRKPLVLKSPSHTGRIKYLLELFPNAKFVHITRDPYTTFMSTLHFYKSYGQILTLQDLDENIIIDSIISRYKRMYNAFHQDIPAIPEGNLCEVPYESLVKNPLPELEQIYNALNLPGFKRVEPVICEYLNTIKNYQTNVLKKISPELKNRIDREWGKFYK